MSDLRTFDTPLKIYEYVNANYFRKLGCGVEGAAYLAKDGSVMKYIQLPSGVVKYNEDIITTSKFKLKSFIFPDELFVCDNLIYGYRTEYFSNDVLCDKYRRSIRIIDLEKFLEAREVKIDDIKVLTDAHYRLKDICGNILFDGERLAAIDTLAYKKDYSITLDDNIFSLDRTLNMYLDIFECRTADEDTSVNDRVKRLIKANNSSEIEVKPLIMYMQV